MDGEQDCVPWKSVSPIIIRFLGVQRYASPDIFTQSNDDQSLAFNFQGLAGALKTFAMIVANDSLWSNIDLSYAFEAR
jgi:hypothetical protein